MAFSPDGRLFVCKQTGQLRVIENNQLLATPFVSLTVDSSGERGLLGVAFDPNFTVNQFVYVYYTATSPTIHNRVSRFTANGNVATGGETVLLDLPTLSSATNHNGGAMHFGLDGKLYIAVGENANGANSQSLANPLGKMLRINSDGTIPDRTTRFSPRRRGSAAQSGRLACATRSRFRSNPRRAGCSSTTSGRTRGKRSTTGSRASNYGWPTTEGATTDPRFRTPVYSYPHATAGAVSGLRHNRRRVLRRDCPRSSRPNTSATIFLLTTAAAGSTSSMTARAPRSRSPRGSRRRLTWQSGLRAACTISRADRPAS